MFALRASREICPKISEWTRWTWNRWLKLSSDKQAQLSLFLSHRFSEKMTESINARMLIRISSLNQSLSISCRQKWTWKHFNIIQYKNCPPHVTKFRVYHVKNSLANWMRFTPKLSHIFLPSLAYMLRNEYHHSEPLTSGKYERIRGIGINNVRLWWRQSIKNILSLSTKTHANAGWSARKKFVLLNFFFALLLPPIYFIFRCFYCL